MTTNWKPHPYQIKAAQHALNNPGAALFLSPGLGKTSITLAVIDVLRKSQQPKFAATLVIAPLRVCYSVWPAEVKKWTEFAHLSVGVLHGPKKDKVLAEQHDIYVVNPEGVKWLLAALEGVKAWPFDCLVVDESTKFKNTGSERFKALRKVLPRFRRRLLLTGTPAANNIADIFGQVFIADNGARLGTYITHFRKQYFDEHRHYMGFSEWLPRADTNDRIRAAVQDICLYMQAEDYLTMPERTDNVIPVTLPAALRPLYKSVAKDFFAQLEAEHSISAAHAAAAQMKLRQVVGGQVYGDAGVETLHTVKVEALIDLIEEQQGQPLLVAVGFRHEADALAAAIKKEFGYAAPYLGGGVSAKASDDIAQRWNRGELPVLLAHPSSVAHGLNLQAGGNSVCWFTLTWSLEEYEQLNGRVYRQGQKRGVVIHHIIMQDTVDEVVYQALAAKTAVQTAFLRPLKGVSHA